jgi:uncharacterized lipoprotein YmbA
MNRPSRFGALAAAIALASSLAACASAPTHYYTLVAPPPQATPASQPAPFAIDVLSVGIPAILDQPQLVVRQGNAGIAVLDGERWAGPLGDELRSALSAQLAYRLQAQDVSGLAKPADKPVLKILVQVRRLDAWPGRLVQLDADWGLGFANEAAGARLACHGQFAESAPGGYPELVQAQQRAVSALADAIGKDALAWAQSRKAGCSSIPRA